VAATQSAQIKMADMARRITLAQLLSLQLGRLKRAKLVGTRHAGQQRGQVAVGRLFLRQRLQQAHHLLGQRRDGIGLHRRVPCQQLGLAQALEDAVQHLVAQHMKGLVQRLPGKARLAQRHQLEKHPQPQPRQAGRPLKQRPQRCLQGVLPFELPPQQRICRRDAIAEIVLHAVGAQRFVGVQGRGQHGARIIDGR
ncbi:MAG: hypothetical protein EOP39_32910, partial [Rubrivivax sp.]